MVAQPGDASVDVALLQRVIARDERALAELYDRHSRLAYSVVLRVLRNPTDAEDVLQETFVRVWTRADTYDGRLGSPAAWLTRIARNRAIDRLRARRARSQVDAALPEPKPDDVPKTLRMTTETPEELAQQSTRASVLRGALAKLPAAQRLLIEAAFFDGCTHQELADRFRLPLGTVKTRIRSGLLSLRGGLEHAV
jgi:RNA polymerase sigma-70 factor (ECF subfamily)